VKRRRDTVENYLLFEMVRYVRQKRRTLCGWVGVDGKGGDGIGAADIKENVLTRKALSH
jgi:hypothetical protein